MKDLQETRGPTFELTRHFLARFFDSDLLARQDAWQSVFGGALALILPCGFALFDSRFYGKYFRLAAFSTSPEPYRQAVLADTLMLLVFAMALVCLLTAVEWQSLFPSRRDYLALAGMPVRPRQILAAKAAALGLAASIFIAAVVALPTAVFPAITMSRWLENPSLAAHVVAFGASLTLSCLFTLFGLVAMQGALLSLAPARLFDRALVWSQAALVAVAIMLASAGIAVGDLPARMADRPAWALLAPPVWFLGLHETILGSREPFALELARRALWSVAIAAAVAAAGYLAGYHRYRRILLETPVRTARRREWGARLLRLLPNRPVDEAFFAFFVKTLSRSRPHKVVLLVHAAAAAALVILALLGGSYGMFAPTDRPGGAVHNPLAMEHAAVCACLFVCGFLLAGVRYAFSLPCEWQANWIFRANEAALGTAWRSALDRFLILAVIAPVIVLAFPFEAAVLGAGRALAVSTLAFGAALLCQERLFRSWEKIPFTCSYLPDSHSVFRGVVWFALGSFCVAPLVSGIILWTAPHPVRFGVTAAVMLGLWLWTRRSRKLYQTPPRYEAVPDTEISRLSAAMDL